MTHRRAYRLFAIGIAVLGVMVVGGLGVYLWQLHRQVAGSSREPPLRRDPDGSLVICGGGATPDAACQTFLELAGGRQARIVVIPAFEPAPGDEADYLGDWKELGAASAVFLHATSRDQCQKPAFVRPLQEATGVWLSGGEQSRLAACYVGTPVESELKALLARGGVIGGSSAGAAVMSRVIILSGRDTATLEQGLGLLEDVLVDQHFLRRNRMDRFLGVLQEHPHLVGLGIDEGTAVLVQRRGTYLSVLGNSYAVVCLPEKEALPRMEILKAGDRIDLARFKETRKQYVIESQHALRGVLGD